MARRLEALAAANTESHMHDMGYWSERSKRSEFATMAYTLTSYSYLTPTVHAPTLAYSLPENLTLAYSLPSRRLADSLTLPTLPGLTWQVHGLAVAAWQ